MPASSGLGSGRPGVLYGVSADSATDVWAVGYDINPTTGATVTLTLHWNGTSWSKVASPNPGGTTSSSNRNVLYGVSAQSPTDAWAVGFDINPTTGASVTLILHWNGTSWSRVASPNPGGTTSSSNGNSLKSVSAISATDAWAVGVYGNPTTGATVTLTTHWNGTSWTKVGSPNPAGTMSSSNRNVLYGVSAQSPTDAWAVGFDMNPTTGVGVTLILHWNGTSWTKLASPNPGDTTSGSGLSFNYLYGVSADSAIDAWAVGVYGDPTTGTGATLVLHWNGTNWSKVDSPNPGTLRSFASFQNRLNSVSANSATNALAVGLYTKGNATSTWFVTLTLHWDGRSWTKVASPNPGGTTSSSESYLEGVSIDSATDAWAAGAYDNSTTGGTLVLRWNGATWSQA
jgi:hypothetical protein